MRQRQFQVMELALVAAYISLNCCMDLRGQSIPRWRNQCKVPPKD